MGAYCLVALALVAAFSRRGGAAAAKVETAPAWLAAYEPDPVRVSREAYLNESASALKAAKPIWSSVVADCVLDVGDGAPAHAKLRAGNESPPLEAVAPAPRLCRVVSTIGGDDFDADLVAVFSIVDSLDYLKRPDNWAAFLNKVAFCAKQKRRLYLWVGDIEKAVLHARPGPLPWMDCNEAPGNTLNIYKAVALLALFKKARPRVKAALYLDADAWFTDVAFSETDGATVEAYMALSADADLFGNQNRVGGPKIIFNGGLMMARNTNWVSHFAALWWRARCGAHDQLPLWATLYASWAAETQSLQLDRGAFRDYDRAHVLVLDALRRDAKPTRLAHPRRDAFDGGDFAATGLLTRPLELPHTLMLPSARTNVGGKYGKYLPAIRSDADETRKTFVCHTKAGKREAGGQCIGDDVCANGKCAPLDGPSKSFLATLFGL